MKNKIYFPPARYLLFIVILVSSLPFPALVNNNGKSNAIAQITRLEPKHFLTLEKPILGFKIHILIIGILPIMILLYLLRHLVTLLLLRSLLPI
jgi:hypothetical protein